MTKLRAFIKAQRKLEQAATPGPWDSCRQDDDNGYIWFDIWCGHSVAHVSELQRPDKEIGKTKHDALFIATSRNNYSKLLDAVEMLSEIVEQALDVHQNLYLTVFDYLPMANAEDDIQRKEMKAKLAAVEELFKED